MKYFIDNDRDIWKWSDDTKELFALYSHNKEQWDYDVEDHMSYKDLNECYHFEELTEAEFFLEMV